MTKYIRPFWFLNVEKIETWLSYMAARGQHLIKLNFFPGTFAFKSGKPRDTVLRIGYAQSREQNRAMKIISGWEEIIRRPGAAYIHWPFHPGLTLLSAHEKTGLCMQLACRG